MPTVRIPTHAHSQDSFTCPQLGILHMPTVRVPSHAHSQGFFICQQSGFLHMSTGFSTYPQSGLLHRSTAKSSLCNPAEATGVVFSLQDTVDHVTFAGRLLGTPRSRAGIWPSSASLPTDAAVWPGSSSPPQSSGPAIPSVTK